MRTSTLVIFLLCSVSLFAQKKPLDHSVYDGWQSIGERHISADGKWVAYAINPQEGDGNLYVHPVQNGSAPTIIPRGYAAQITADGRYLVCRIRAPFADTRAARIKKKKGAEMPKDSLAILELESARLQKFARVASYKLPVENGGWLAFHKEKEATKQTSAATQKTVDSLQKKVDSLLQLVTQLKNIKGGSADADFAEPGDEEGNGNEGSDLVLRNLATGQERVFANVGEYVFNKKGTRLLLKSLRKAGDKTGQNSIVLFDLQSARVDTILKGGNDFKNLALSDDGSKAAFVAERDSAAKALQKFYGLYLYRQGSDTAQKIVHQQTPGMPQAWTVSEWGTLDFSPSGNRLFFGTAPIRTPKDTTLVEIDAVKLDIWHYKDDYLQSQQLFNLQNELKRSYSAVFDLQQGKMIQLGDKDFPSVLQTGEGDGATFYVTTDTGRRVQAQWAGRTAKDLYAVDVATGKRTLVKKALDGVIYPSSTGRYVAWYDAPAKNYFSWDGTAVRKISAGVPFPLYDEEHDVPSHPSPHGIMGWHQQDSAFYVYDKYDVWRLDPKGKAAPALMFAAQQNRKQGLTVRYIRTDTTERFFTFSQQLLFRVFNHKTKYNHLLQASFADGATASLFLKDSFNYNNVSKARNNSTLLYTKERFTHSPNVFVNTAGVQDAAFEKNGEQQLSHTNPQQSGYNWGTAELFRWTTFNGKKSEGILYKPEDFDSTKKYPVLIYFYEKLSEGLHNYTAPAPTPSRLNIPFFVSRGYLVFAPDISYTKGQPAKDAYNYIVSGAQTLAKKKWVDAKNMGIQGQSWGGYQVVALLVQTDMFKAAWAGAPVANMTSAYGGIRWESGMNRQFQYEKQQSRIGASLWERPDLYIQNSPLFQLPKVKTPLVIMANDADGAVPWYQGIELFTALRRLGKPVWMLNYNGEAHNLVERKNRKDIQIREQQYFDWLLKGAAPARWITEGVPAIEKGKTWGLEQVSSF